jgi:hypothetical protein
MSQFMSNPSFRDANNNSNGTTTNISNSSDNFNDTDGFGFSQSNSGIFSPSSLSGGSSSDEAHDPDASLGVALPLDLTRALSTPSVQRTSSGLSQSQQAANNLSKYQTSAQRQLLFRKYARTGGNAQACQIARTYYSNKSAGSNVSELQRSVAVGGVIQRNAAVLTGANTITNVIMNNLGAAGEAANALRPVAGQLASWLAANAGNFVNAVVRYGAQALRFVSFQAIRSLLTSAAAGAASVVGSISLSGVLMGVGLVLGAIVIGGLVYLIITDQTPQDLINQFAGVSKPAPSFTPTQEPAPSPTTNSARPLPLPSSSADMPTLSDPTTQLDNYKPTPLPQYKPRPRPRPAQSGLYNQMVEVKEQASKLTSQWTGRINFDSALGRAFGDLLDASNALGDMLWNAGTVQGRNPDVLNRINEQSARAQMQKVQNAIAAFEAALANRKTQEAQEADNNRKQQELQAQSEKAFYCYDASKEYVSALYAHLGQMLHLGSSTISYDNRVQALSRTFLPSLQPLLERLAQFEDAAKQAEGGSLQTQRFAGRVTPEQLQLSKQIEELVNKLDAEWKNLSKKVASEGVAIVLEGAGAGGSNRGTGNIASPPGGNGGNGGNRNNNNPNNSGGGREPIKVGYALTERQDPAASIREQAGERYRNSLPDGRELNVPAREMLDLIKQTEIDWSQFEPGMSGMVGERHEFVLHALRHVYKAAAAKYRVPVTLLMAISEQESNSQYAWFEAFKMSLNNKEGGGRYALNIGQMRSNTVGLGQRLGYEWRPDEKTANGRAVEPPETVKQQLFQIMQHPAGNIFASALHLRRNFEQLFPDQKDLPPEQWTPYHWKMVAGSFGPTGMARPPEALASSTTNKNGQPVKLRPGTVEYEGRSRAAIAASLDNLERNDRYGRNLYNPNNLKRFNELLQDNAQPRLSQPHLAGVASNIRIAGALHEKTAATRESLGLPSAQIDFLDGRSSQGEQNYRQWLQKNGQAPNEIWLGYEQERRGNTQTRRVQFGQGGKSPYPIEQEHPDDTKAREQYNRANPQPDPDPLPEAPPGYEYYETPNGYSMREKR